MIISSNENTNTGSANQMTQTIFNVGDKVQLTATIKMIMGSYYPIGTLATVDAIGVNGSVHIVFDDKEWVTVKTYEIAPAASEPTAEAAPTHRFPVGAIVVISGSDTECTEQTGIIQERHISRYGLLQYTVSGQQFRICESELAAL